MKIKYHSIFLFIFLIIFRILLDISYVNIITDMYSSQGLLYNYEEFNYTISWIIYLITFVIVKVDCLKVSDYFFVTAILSVIAPMTCIYGLDLNRSFYPLLITITGILIIYFVVKVRIISFKRMPIILNGNKIILYMAIVAVAYLIIWYYISGAHFNLNFTKVYDYRIHNAELVNIGILSYLNNWVYQVFTIFLMAYSLYYKRYQFFVILFVIQVYFFAMSTHKSILFLPFLIFGIWLYFREHKKIIILPIMFSFVLLSSIISFYIFDDKWLTALFSYRVFFVPADLTFIYFDFFSINEYIFWSNSILSNFFVYPYEENLAKLIGNYIGHGFNANNGYISTGYSNAGVFGVILYSLLIGIILVFINDITYQRLPLWLSLSLCVVPLRNLLISIDLFTVLLTGGLFVSLIIIFFIRDIKKEG